MLYSLNDPIIQPENIEAIASKWREKGSIAHTQFWNEAPHVQIFTKYPDEYTKAVLSFIRQCGLGKPSKDFQKKEFLDEKVKILDDFRGHQKQQLRVG